MICVQQTFSILLIASIFVKRIKCDQITIGAIFEDENVIRRNYFYKAIDEINNELDDEEGLEVESKTALITNGNAYATSKNLCSIMESGVVAVFGPISNAPAIHSMSICDAKEIPYIDARWDLEASLPTINVHPHPYRAAQVLSDVIDAYGWKQFVVLYESGIYLAVVANLLHTYGMRGYKVQVKRFELNLQGNYRYVLRRIKMSEENTFLVICSIKTLPELLKQAQQVGLMTNQYNYIIENLDFHTLDLEPYQYCEANITGFRIINPNDKRITGRRDDEEKPDDDAPYSEPCNVTLSAGLTYDGVNLLAKTIKMLGSDKFEAVKLSCNNTDSWGKGSTLVNFLKETSYDGLTGHVAFDNRGLRTNFKLDILELTLEGLVVIGTWNSTEGIRFKPRKPKVIEYDERHLKDKEFIVVTALTPPYGMLKNSSITLTGNDQYEGYCIDLIEELSLLLGFKYTFVIQQDGDNGMQNEQGEWTGMIRKVRTGEVDLAITDLTITSVREQAVDFTLPFMKLGISILYKRPTKEAPKLFSFMEPFSNEVWIYLGISFVGVSLSLFVLGRLSPTEWDNPYPCIEEPTVLLNQFTLQNSLWFSTGALLQQGSEVAPKAPSTRTIASIWWFFTIIMVASYTANLAAFLTIENTISPINNAEDLANKEGKIKYGAKYGGATYNFFKESKYPTYVKMFEYMENHMSEQPLSNDAGVIKVEEEDYAFLMESTSIQYIIERHCALAQVNGELDEKGYGIAMKKKSPYRDALSQAVLTLQETGRLESLKNKWWKEKGGGGSCDKKKSEGADELDLDNLGGVFFVLAVGSFFAALFGVAEWLWEIYKHSKVTKETFKDVFKEELKIVLNCSSGTKAVWQNKSSSIGSRRSSMTLESTKTGSSKNMS